MQVMKTQYWDLPDKNCDFDQVMLFETQQSQDMQKQQISTTHMHPGLLSYQDKMQKYRFWMQWLIPKKLVLEPPRRDGL